MITQLSLEQDKKTGEILATASGYTPSQDVKDRTAQVMEDFRQADTLRNKPYLEFNNFSLVNRMNADQMSWNAFVDSPSQDPAEAWKSQAFRPIVRNKIVAIAAHITASVIYPKIYAQNSNDVEDRDAAEVMRDIMDWVNENSGYDKTFMTAVIDAMVNPLAFVHVEFSEKYRDVKIRDENGKIQVKTILDELYSGFQSSIVSCDELWVADFYEPNIQKQPYIIWRRVIDYSTAQAKYHGNEIFDQYVKPGIQFLYSDMRNLFYQVYDTELGNRLVEEVIYYNREADLQITFLNGILLDDVNNPNPRRDKNYPFVKMMYEMITDRFFYGKSLAYKLTADEVVLNTLYRMVIDGTYIQIMPPSVVFGSEAIGSPVIAPGAVTTISNEMNPHASFQTIATNNNLTAGMNMIGMVERSMSESSIDPISAGMNPQHRETAFAMSKMEQNARTIMGLFNKSVTHLVRDLGLLQISDILQFMTIGEAVQTMDDTTMLKFRSMLIPNKRSNGKMKTRKIQFDMSLPSEKDIPKKDLEKLQWDVWETEQKFGDHMQIYKVNPELFRSLQFKIQVDAEAIAPKSDALEKAIMLEEYGYAIQNPMVDKEAVTRDLLLGAYDKTKGDPEKYMIKQGTGMPANPMSGMAGSPNPFGSPEEMMQGAQSAQMGQGGGQQQLLKSLTQGGKVPLGA